MIVLKSIYYIIEGMVEIRLFCTFKRKNVIFSYIDKPLICIWEQILKYWALVWNIFLWLYENCIEFFWFKLCKLWPWTLSLLFHLKRQIATGVVTLDCCYIRSHSVSWRNLFLLMGRIVCKIDVYSTQQFHCRKDQELCCINKGTVE